MKLKYYTLNKEDRYKTKIDFYDTPFGNSIKIRLNRLLIIGIISLLFSIYLFISHTNPWELITSIMLFIASLIFIIGSYIIRIRKINDYLVKKKK